MVTLVKIINLFRTSEHEFMYLKAKLFGDTEIIKKIVRARDPSEAKALGLQVLTKKSGEITSINLCYKPCGINLARTQARVNFPCLRKTST